MNFTLVKLKNEHIPLLEHWLNKPYIQKYFGEPEEWLEEIKANIHKEEWVHYYIAIAAYPIGFCQYYNTAKAPKGIWSSEPAHIVGIDFLIGEEDHLGKGFGKLLLAALLQKIKEDASVSYIIADPNKENIVSIGLLEQFGFKLKKNGLYSLNLPGPTF